MIVETQREEKGADQVTDGQIQRNIFSGLLLQGLLIALGLLAVPFIVRGLGNDRYALLSLSVTLIGYFSLMDFGLGQGMVRYLSEYTGRADDAAKQEVISSGILVFPILGVVAGVILVGFTPFIVKYGLRLPTGLQQTAAVVFYLTAVGLPLMFLKVYFEAIPSAHQRIDLINWAGFFANASKLIAGVLLILGGYGLKSIIISHIALTCIQVILLWRISIGCLPPHIRVRPKFNKAVVLELFRYSGLVSVTNLTSQLIVNSDKILISFFLPIGALAYYTVAFELASKLWHIPNIVMRAYGPAFSCLSGRADLLGIRRHYMTSVRKIAIAATFLAAMMVFFPKEILSYWISPEYGSEAWVVLATLAVGLLLSCYTIGPYTLIMAIGRAEVTSKIHGILVLIHIGLCLVFIPRLGIAGAGLSWCIVHLLDVILLWQWIESNLLSKSVMVTLRQAVAIPMSISGIFVAILSLIPQAIMGNAVGFVAMTMIGFGSYLAASYFLVFDVEEQKAIRSFARI